MRKLVSPFVCVLLAMVISTMSSCKRGGNRLQVIELSDSAQIDTISTLAKKHDFTLAGFRNFEHAVTLEMIEKIKGNVKR